MAYKANADGSLPPPGQAAFVVENKQGRRFAVRLLREGAAYGLRRSLVWDDPKYGVEFYDATYAGDPRFEPEGQFVSRYYVNSLLDNCAQGFGLNLDGGIPEWRLDGAAMTRLGEALREVLSNDANYKPEADDDATSRGAKLKGARF